MKSYLDVYDIYIEALGPVFIGNGKEITKNEYLYLGEKKKILIPDQARWFAYLSAKGKLEQYEHYLLNNQKDSLAVWCKKQKIELSEVESCCKYSLECGDYIENRGKTLQILEFVKDGMGAPYIPGSSLKGMLRTILLSEDLIVRNKKYDKEKRQICMSNQKGNIYLGRESKAVETRRFHTLQRTEKSQEAVNDVLAGIRIGDSDPLTYDDLILAQKIETGNDGREKSLNLLRESLRPGTRIRFTMTMDRSLCNISVDQIMGAVKRFGEMYHQVFLSKFRDERRLRFSEPEENTVWLGGGSGFVTKTIVYPLFGPKQGIEMTVKVFERTLNQKIASQHKHFLDKGKGVSPHIVKRTIYGGRRYEMGKCRLMIQKK